MADIGKEGSNPFTYQGKEWQTDLDLELYDFHARQFDPTTGRFFAVDPAGQFASGYVGMGNNPVIGVDPDGRLAWFVPLIIGAALNVGSQAAQGNINSFGDALGQAAIGAAIGALTGGIGSAVGNATSATLGSLGSTLAGGGAAGLFGGGISSTINGGSLIGGAWRGALTGIVGAGLGGFGSVENFGANLAAGIGEGAVTGALGAALYGGGIGQGALYGGIGGGIFAIGTSPHVSNAFRGKGFKNNSSVLGDFVTAGNYQGALDYFGFEGTFDPSKTFGGPAVTDPVTGGISYADGAFGTFNASGKLTANYDILRQTYDHELFHRANVLAGKYRGVTITPQIKGIEEHGAYLRNYKRRGLYPAGREVTGRIDYYGAIGAIYEHPSFFKVKRSHFINRIPRRY